MKIMKQGNWLSVGEATGDPIEVKEGLCRR